jgi:hypothetical protein
MGLHTRLYGAGWRGGGGGSEMFPISALISFRSTAVGVSKRLYLQPAPCAFTLSSPIFPRSIVHSNVVLFEQCCLFHVANTEDDRTQKFGSQNVIAWETVAFPAF